MKYTFLDLGANGAIGIQHGIPVNSYCVLVVVDGDCGGLNYECGQVLTAGSSRYLPAADKDCDKRCCSQFYGPRPGGFKQRNNERRGEASSRPRKSCAAKSVAGESKYRWADLAGDASTNLMATDDGAHDLSLSSAMKIDQIGRSDLGIVLHGAVSDNSSDIHDCVHVHARTRLTGGIIDFRHIFHEEVCLFPPDGL